MNRWKRLLSLLLCVLLAAGCLFGCKGASESSGPAVPENAVVDGAGRVLTIPDDPSAATIASVYAVSVPFIVALGLTDRVLAINTKSLFWTNADEHLAAAGTVGRGVVDLEALAGFAPSVLIHRSNDPETIAAVEPLGVEVLCITVEDLGDIQSTLRLMGRYFGREARAEEVCAWLDGKFEKIDGIVAGIPQEERVTALMMGGELGRIAGGDMLQSWMLEKAGGKCVANDTSNNRSWLNIGVETVFTWNPDVVFCTSSTALDYTVDKLYADASWDAVNAVKNRRVHVMPAKIDSWDMPGVNCALGTMYMLYRMYPSYFSAAELQAEIDEYYTFMFGRTFDGAYLGYALED